MQRVNNVFADVINESPSRHMANTLVSCILNSITRSHIILQNRNFFAQACIIHTEVLLSGRSTIARSYDPICSFAQEKS